MADRYEMQIHKSEFTPLRIDNSFKIKVIDKFEDGENEFIEFIKSIDNNLGDWEQRPTIEDVKARLKGVSKCTLFYHEDIEQAIGWGWFSPVFTYDWINEVHPLPTDNSTYWGGTYIRKDLDIPKSTGLQMYNHGFTLFLSFSDYMVIWMHGTKLLLRYVIR